MGVPLGPDLDLPERDQLRLHTHSLLLASGSCWLWIDVGSGRGGRKDVASALRPLLRAAGRLNLDGEEGLRCAASAGRDGYAGGVMLPARVDFAGSKPEDLLALYATIGFNAISPGDVRYQVKARRLAQGHGVPVSSTGDEMRRSQRAPP